jgi:hypothetical protein
MTGFKHETIMGSKVYFGKGITEKQKETLRELIKGNPRIYNYDTHFWLSDGKIKLQQLVGKEYFGNVYEADIYNKRLRAVI